MIKLSLLGKNISHSKSKEVYESLLSQKIDYTYLDFDQAKFVPKLEKIFGSIQGLSITAPYKKLFLAKVQLDEKIRHLSSINCIRNIDRIFEGTNTDYLALCELIPELILKFKPKKIVLLGNGAMADITSLILNNSKISFVQFFRKKDGSILNLPLIDFASDKTLVINSCSRDFVYSDFSNKNIIWWDYNYSFEAHENFFKDKVLSYVDGMNLLERQALFAIKFWNIKA